MTARNYIPQPGDLLNKNMYYHNNFPKKIKIIKITRAGFIHFKDANMSTDTNGTHQSRMSLHTLRKCFVIDKTEDNRDNEL